MPPFPRPSFSRLFFSRFPCYPDPVVYSIDKWLWGYVRSVLRRPRKVEGTKHLLVCVADHHEPFGYGTSRTETLDRVREWTRRYAAVFDSFRDADGCPPRQTLFYPAEQYDPECLDILADLCRRGYGEIEIHLHHDNDTAQGTTEKLVRFRDALNARHGLLGCDSTGAVRYGFVHGNWALCNARRDGCHCGVNEELSVLAATGCYADFTYPSAPDSTQPRMVNAIYRAVDSPHGRGQDRGELVTTPEFRGSRKESQKGTKCREGISPRRHGGTEQKREGEACGNAVAADGSHIPASVCLGGNPEGHRWSGDLLGDTCEAQGPVGRASRRDQSLKSSNLQSSLNPQLSPSGDVVPNGGSRPAFSPQPSRLMLIQGPLALDWRRKKGIIPRLETAANEQHSLAIGATMRLAARQHIHVRGRPEWVFLKLHTHGALPANTFAMFRYGKPERQNHLRCLSKEYNDGREWILHYVTAREMYNIARAAEDGLAGNPADHRDYEVKPPAVCGGIG